MRSLITGVTGQDGSYLAELLAASGESVTGLLHPHQELPGYLHSPAESGRLTIVPCELSDPGALRHLLRELSPVRVFHFAALSQPQLCEQEPVQSRQVNVVSCEVLLEWQKRDQPDARVLLVSSATVFGNPAQTPQNEHTPAAPQGEYARQKQEVRELAAAARSDGLFTACAIPFNHESERRPEDFVFAKVCNSAARIALGQQQTLRLASLAPRRDWGYAPEYVQAMAWMLEVDRALELVLGSGESHSVEELVRAACETAQIDYSARVIADSTAGLGLQPGPPALQADPELAWKELGWKAQTRFKALVERLTLAALERYRAA